ncbi:uncharacterized protein LOC118675777 isoform X1 [Myotis myotis]|uniref:uncharacterized protein LOC118675777 isoform X1 n=1 Tax=Myotis myotis TaxID=51298 RepID=UPI00174AF61E|nr:uncharacterized protein LOC118675777 isoform X1 [Myotis myotis]
MHPGKGRVGVRWNLRALHSRDVRWEHRAKPGAIVLTFSCFQRLLPFTLAARLTVGGLRGRFPRMLRRSGEAWISPHGQRWCLIRGERSRKLCLPEGIQPARSMTIVGAWGLVKWFHSPLEVAKNLTSQRRQPKGASHICCCDCGEDGRGTECFPGPQGLAPPATRNLRDPRAKKKPFPCFPAGAAEAGRIQQEVGLQAPGPRLRAQWPPREGADSHGLLWFPPTLQRALLFPERALGIDNPYPSHRRRRAQCLTRQPEARVAPGKVRQ